MLKQSKEVKSVVYLCKISIFEFIDSINSYLDKHSSVSSAIVMCVV